MEQIKFNVTHRVGEQLVTETISANNLTTAAMYVEEHLNYDLVKIERIL